MVETIIDTKQVKRQLIELEGLSRKGAPAAVSAALNRAAQHASTLAKKEARKHYEIKAEYVKQAFKTIRRASVTKLKATIPISGHTRSLTRFKVKPVKVPRQKGVKVSARKQVQVKIKKLEGFKTIKTKPGAFLQVMKNATNVWQRKGTGKSDVKVLRSLSVPQMVGSEKAIEEIKRKALEMVDKRLTHEINYRLDKIKSRGGK